MRTATQGREGCDGLCSGLGVAYEIVDDVDCEDALPSRDVIKYAKERAKEFADKICSHQSQNCFCYGKYHRVAVGSARVKEGDDDACLVYAIYFYSGKCSDVI